MVSKGVFLGNLFASVIFVALALRPASTFPDRLFRAICIISIPLSAIWWFVPLAKAIWQLS